MLGRKRGGLEQAAIDYAEALNLANLPAVTLLSPDSWAETAIATAGVSFETIKNNGRLDFFAPARLRNRAEQQQARAILCHGNRALSLALRAFSDQTDRPRIIAVAHNYSTHRFTQADACFALTEHMAEHLKQSGNEHITLMPNMVRMPAKLAPRPARREPPVIGSMGRLVTKKGFTTWLEALSLLRQRGIAFQAILGGEGEEASHLDSLIEAYSLTPHLTRQGWVKDKAAFFESIDLFVLPSWHEPFGIVLIEAMAHGVPVISTTSEGPSEILTSGMDGLLVPTKNPEALANAMAEMLAQPKQAETMAQAALALVREKYSKEAMATRLQTALAPYI